MASTKTSASTLKAFNGNPENFGIFFERLTARLRKKAPNIKYVLKGAGPFTGMTYSNAQEDANEIDLSLNISLATPIKNKTNPSEDNKEKESASSEESKQATDKRTRILFVHYCEIIYDIILENISDSVLRKLKNNGLTSGDGATAYKCSFSMHCTSPVQMDYLSQTSGNLSK